MGTKPAPKNETLLERRPRREWVLPTYAQFAARAQLLQNIQR